VSKKVETVQYSFVSNVTGLPMVRQGLKRARRPTTLSASFPGKPVSRKAGKPKGREAEKPKGRKPGKPGSREGPKRPK
jgi:hypothetical protein